MAERFTDEFLDPETKGDRRAFFRRTVGRLAEELVQRAERRVSPQPVLRPPGALEEVAFLAACTRSGAGLAAGTPMIDPNVQPCTVCDTIPCIEACPTDALEMPPQLWEGYRMAALELVPERCIVFEGVTCGLCARVCPLGERAIRLDDKGRPVLLAEGCVGCGVCVRACVTTPSSLKLKLI
jgi:ferredoxin-type protein NapG/ferredoxin-type protein NapH